MTLLPGLSLLILGLLAMLVAVHVRGLRYFDRPALARNAWFDPILAILKWLLVLGGLLLLYRASPPSFLAAVSVLLAAAAYRRFIRSGFFQERLLRRDVAALRLGRPDLSEEEILFEIACRKHPGWGPELIEQMVKDYPTVESFARMLGRMERGFRGFGGKRPATWRRGRS